MYFQRSAFRVKSCIDVCAPTSNRNCTLSPSYPASRGVNGSAGCIPCEIGCIGNLKHPLPVQVESMFDPPGGCTLNAAFGRVFRDANEYARSVALTVVDPPVPPCSG